MSRADAAWLRMDRTTNLMVIHGVLWLGTPPDWDAVRRVFRERVLDAFPRFSERPCRDGLRRRASWEPMPGFDPDAHFHHVALPAPGDRRALEALVGELASQPLDHDRPLWEAYLIDGYGRGAAILLRIHHAVADGISLARVMLALADGDAGAGGLDAEAPPVHRTPVDHLVSATRGAIGVGTAVARAAGSALLSPTAVSTIADRGRRDTAAFAKLVLPGTESTDALKPGPGVVRRVGWSAPYDLWRVKAAGRAFDATVNDVLVAALCGALRLHTSVRRDGVAEVHALVPFNLRPLDRPVPRDLGNRFGLVLLALPLQVDDRLERLIAVRRRMSDIKASDEGLIAYGILDAMGRTPAAVERLLVDYFTSKGSLILTNVPGPRHGVRLAGVPVEGVLVWAPCSGDIEMSVSLFSYAGKVTVGFLVDAVLEPEPERLAAAFRDELRAYARLARETVQTADDADGRAHS